MQSVIKNKKAILMPEILKIIIGVLCIVVLIYLAVKIYGASTGRTEIEQARVHLETINRIIENIKEDESQEYILLSPKDWLLTGWPINDGHYLIDVDQSPLIKYKDSDMPDKCMESNWKYCLCMCGPVNKDKNEILNACNELSLCKEIKIDLEKNPAIHISRLIANKKPIIISFKDNKLSITVKNG